MEALDTFRTAPYMHNCAQAVAFHWKELYPEKDSIVDSYKSYRGGMAPEGYCGALYAAMQARPKDAENIKIRFKSIIGATKCHEIKAIGTPCPLCVKTADQLLSLKK